MAEARRPSLIVPIDRPRLRSRLCAPSQEKPRPAKLSARPLGVPRAHVPTVRTALRKYRPLPDPVSIRPITARALQFAGAAFAAATNTFCDQKDTLAKRDAAAGFRGREASNLIRCH